MDQPIEFLSAVLIVLRDPARLASFYRDVVGIPLKNENHGDGEPHFGCTLGDVHFAIHPLETFPGTKSEVGSVKLAFTVYDMDATVEGLSRHGVRLLATPAFSSAPRSRIPTGT